ncbi:MAG TPA: glutamate synthase central domain-containing protein, partial [Pyrinomonadaceae bacterium]|nr:glutamate synthase central domain-containing protein [Pyrinomonadaceae bacterium]
ESLKIALPPAGQYAVGMVFLPTEEKSRHQCQDLFAAIVREEGQSVLGWRTVPTENSTLGPTAKASQPVIQQLFIARGEGLADDLAFERKLCVIRKRISKAAKRGIHERRMFYVPSLSCRTIVYKGMLTAGQLSLFYPDLGNFALESALALVHSRFSTNTFPSWARAHPYRYVAHNGEINTLRGNINWMRARESKFKSQSFGPEIHKILPVIDTETSDSGMFDNALEMLTLTGRSLQHAVMMMIPEPWGGHESMSEEKKAFYEYHSCLMEPWDGPASIAFTDGVRIGAVLDRNGLRPSRYYVTKDDLVIMASEVGVLDIPPDRVLQKGRLRPGRMLLVDTEAGRIVDDEELKQQIATEHPYGRWLRDNLVNLDKLPSPAQTSEPDLLTLRQRQKAFGYTNEELKLLLTPMATDGNEPIGSMGSDTPLAVLSERPQLLYNYFKQLFAQITNPPVDAIREELVMSTDTTVGPEANMLEPTEECARLIKLRSPILTNYQMEKLRHLEDADNRFGNSSFRSITLPMLYEVNGGSRSLERALDELCNQSNRAILRGFGIIILSDRGVTRELAAIPALLAVAAIHHHLIREGIRTQVGFVIESGEPREVHHFALLLGYGAAAINPYLAFETLHEMTTQGLLAGVDVDKAISNYIKAINKGIVKVISKMGISTIQSYCGAQIFEAVGLNEELVDRYFTWTPSRIGGIGLDVIAEESKLRHKRGFPDRQAYEQVISEGGEYQWRRDGEYHLFNPETIHKLQHACRANSYRVFKEYSELVDNQAHHLCTLRGLMTFKPMRHPIP